MKGLMCFSVCVIAGSTLGFADEVSDWNQVLLRSMLVAPATAAPTTTRVAAIVQSAVFDAVNGIARHYTPIFVPAEGPAGASKGAAATQAAYVTLVSLYPDQKAKFDQLRAASISALNESEDAVQQGLAWGQTVADQILAWRSRDGFSDTVSPFMGGTDPGQWRPTPPANAAGLIPQLATVTPFVIRSPSQFRPAGPNDLNTDEYTADFNETKLMGAATGAPRTADQTLLARFWQAGNPPDYWDQVVTSLAAQRNMTMLHTARMLALVDVAMADAIIGCWDAKYKYSSWRPITAIQLAGSDSNDATAADSAWTPLITNPPFPEYPSAHGCASGAAARLLSDYFGEETTFQVVSNAMPGVTRTFRSFTAALSELQTARIVGGIHFRKATVDGTALGIAVANYVLGHTMLPAHGGAGKAQGQ